MDMSRYLGIARSLALYYGVPFRMRRMRGFYARLVPDGGLCFDVGAHVGSRLRCFRSLGARVVALEPQPDFARILRRLYGRDPGVTILEAAVGADPGESDLLLSVRTPTVTSLNPQWVSQVSGTTGFRHVDWARGPRVAVTTLDTLVREHGIPDFVKIDVEGMEPAVLAGLSRALPALSFEYLPAGRELAVACIDRLAGLGDYRYNWSVGETSRFGSPAWISPQAAREWLGRLKPDAGSGDLYARILAGKHESASEAERIRLRHAGYARRVERAHGARAVEPAILVELARQDGLEVVARHLGLRPIDHADRTLQPGLE
jgi:FkbM family methyltransferase